MSGDIRPGRSPSVRARPRGSRASSPPSRWRGRPQGQARGQARPRPGHEGAPLLTKVPNFFVYDYPFCPRRGSGSGSGSTTRRSSKLPSRRVGGAASRSSAGRRSATWTASSGAEVRRRPQRDRQPQRRQLPGLHPGQGRQAGGDPHPQHHRPGPARVAGHVLVAQEDHRDREGGMIPAPRGGTPARREPRPPVRSRKCSLDLQDLAVGRHLDPAGLAPLVLAEDLEGVLARPTRPVELGRRARPWPPPPSTWRAVCRAARARIPRPPAAADRAHTATAANLALLRIIHPFRPVGDGINRRRPG